jgi:hypothetical protein
MNNLTDEHRRLIDQFDEIADTIPGDKAGPYYGIVEWVKLLISEREKNRALFEICGNAIVQYYQAVEDGLPAKAESFLQELLTALYIYCPKDPENEEFSELARKMRLHIWTIKDLK